MIKYKNEFRIIDTQEKAYFLGFMFGDGTITNYKEKNGRIRFLTKISIADYDSNMIFILKENFPFLNIGNFDYSIYDENFKKQISISKSSKDMYYDLMLNGVYPRKSYENAKYLKLPELSSDLIPHFIRGFFDADGSVYRRSKRKNLITIEFCSVSKEFLININNYLLNNNITSWKIVEKLPKLNRQISYSLQIIKTSELLKIIDLIYLNSKIHLERKKSICLSFKPVNKILNKNMNCPYCNSDLIMNNGKRNNSIRYKCKKCNKNFSIKIVTNI